MNDLMEQLKNLKSFDLDREKSREIRSRMLDLYASTHANTSFLYKISGWKIFKHWEPAFISIITLALSFDLIQIIRFLHGV